MWLPPQPGLVRGLQQETRSTSTMAKTSSTKAKTSSGVKLTAKVHIPLRMVDPSYTGPARIERGEAFTCSASVAAKLKAAGYAA